ncbi:hypothetical protein SAMN05216388_100944 [Halorientalis persicus]|uniref:Uncharacterized protein n=1 Tax=Halorientalis persicus TaxID=1367881 RepID=A0A1H8MLU7_9EURY|nr:hypothetical protein [Halorientalis persicus]SEO18264.1 hypothetical protein SAMN05216388_100944 [Halorientalis persicus]
MTTHIPRSRSTGCTVGVVGSQYINNTMLASVEPPTLGVRDCPETDCKNYDKLFATVDSHLVRLNPDEILVPGGSGPENAAHHWGDIHNVDVSVTTEHGGEMPHWLRQRAVMQRADKLLALVATTKRLCTNSSGFVVPENPDERGLAIVNEAQDRFADGDRIAVVVTSSRPSSPSSSGSAQPR